MYCRSCGTQNDDNNYRCIQCGEVIQFLSTPPQTTYRIEEDAGMRMLLPVGRSLWALIAGYFGLFAILIFPAPIALVTGIIAVIDIRRNEKKRGMGRAIFAIVMGFIFSIFFVFSMLGLLADVFNGVE